MAHTGLSDIINVTGVKAAAREWAEQRAMTEDRKFPVARRLKSFSAGRTAFSPAGENARYESAKLTPEPRPNFGRMCHAFDYRNVDRAAAKAELMRAQLLLAAFQRREVKVASEPQALLAVPRDATYCFKRIGLEAGPLSQWLYGALAETGLPVICVETRHMQAALKAQINKTDRNDARGMAQMMRVGLYRPVHVKTLRSQKLRMLLTHRKLVQSKAIALDNDLRGTLRNFGLKVKVVGTVKFEARVRELVENLPDVAELVEPLLIVRRVLREQLGILHRRLLAIVRDDDVCRRLMTIPGVGPVVALTYRATVDVPVRFRKSKSVGASISPDWYLAQVNPKTCSTSSSNPMLEGP
jgi:transposase